MSAMSTKSRQVSCAVMLLAVGILGSAGDLAGQDKSQTVTRAGSQPSTKGPAEYFTGNVRVDPLFAANESAPYSGGYVTFEPGARSNWHTHPAGQRLIVTHGVGRTQEWGGPIVEVRAGDHVWCPPGVKHWHGASPTTGNDASRADRNARRQERGVDGKSHRRAIRQMTRS